MVLVGYWPLDGDASEVRNGYDGDVEGAEPVEGILSGQSFKFEDGDRIIAEGYKGVSGSQNRTVVLWLKTSTAGGGIISWGNDSANSDSDDGTTFSLSTDPYEGSTGHLGTSVYGGTIEGSTRIDDGQWHMIAVRLKGNKVSDLRIFVDGFEDDTEVVRDGDTNIDTYEDRDVVIGGLPSRISNVRIYDHALTDQEIQYLYQVGSRGLHVSDRRSL